MFQRLCLPICLLLIGSSLFSQLRSPESFLGYAPGSRFTPHWKIAAYFRHVAEQVPERVLLKNYSETPEGRPLLLAVVASPTNLKQIENLRINNLRLAGLGPDGGNATETGAPAFVWLSYNVHGNEASSSEASLLALHALVDPSNAQARAWLENTIVLIDPCLNPDGRDRYVNWYNSVVGRTMNPTPFAREHREPWPYGRTNHYQFDLNRDWAWQSQPESRARIREYRNWMPQVHVDYHEQGYNEPYYFAPAAEPYHEVVTPWQREFQQLIGKNHARYFDANGWLYFTKLRFDLLYPSYGDTWPTFNGAIGMTYEQGGISAGLGVINEDGDTLTLNDRVQHHFTTSLSTVETASKQASRLIAEYHNYFNRAQQAGVGEYKTYVIRNQPSDAQRIDRLVTLLDQNGIRYATGTGSGRGYSYRSGTEEAFTYSSGDIVITSLQPRSALVKVLFEPASRLSDSVTYDITAWSLPYAFGLTAYASRDKLPASVTYSRPAVSSPTTTYGYVLPWVGVRTVRAMGQLLQRGIRLRQAEQPFESGGQRFGSGAIVILATSNAAFGNSLWAEVRSVADANGVGLFPVGSGMVDKGYDFGSDMVHPVRAPRIVMLTGDGVSPYAAGGIWSFFEQELDYPITQVNTTDVQRIEWASTDVLILPDGNYRFLSDKEQTDALKNWVRKGGRVIALEGAVSQLSRMDLGPKSKKQEPDDAKKKDLPDYDHLRRFEDRERDAVSGSTPGSIYRVQLDNTHPLAWGYPDHYYTLKQDDRIFDFISENGWNVGVIKREKPIAGFVGTALRPRLQDGLLFGVQSLGAGHIISLTDDPLFRNFWENGKLLFCNAVFAAGL